MAPVIFGLNLADMKWGKFKSSYMFKNRDYHLRRTKFVVYQLAMIFCVVSESLGTAALSDYIDQQRLVQVLDNRTYVYNNDYVGVASYNIFAGVFTAFIFGAAFFFDLFFPTRNEDHGIRVAWKACAVAAVIFQGASAFALTIITAKRSGYVTGVSPERANELLGRFTKDGGAPLQYRDNGRALAAVVFVWPGWICVIISCVLMFLSIDNAEKGPGPLSKHAREAEAEKAQHKARNCNNTDLEANYGEASEDDAKSTSEMPNGLDENLAASTEPNAHSHGSTLAPSTACPHCGAPRNETPAATQQPSTEH